MLFLRCSLQVPHDKLLHATCEIGSITKVFTALLLADMANKREVSLDDPAAKHLPAGHRMLSLIHVPDRSIRRNRLATDPVRKGSVAVGSDAIA